MMLTSTDEFRHVVGGIDIFSPLGLLILATGILFTVGLPLIMILKGRKD